MTTTHPTPEELMDVLYGDADPDRRAAVSAHTAQCEQCRGQLAAWGGVRRGLAAWQLPEPPAKAPAVIAAPSRVFVAVRWAAAAAVFLASGYAFARLSAPQPVDVAAMKDSLNREIRDELKLALRGELKGELRGELRADLGADLAAAMKAEQAKFVEDQARSRDAFQRDVVQVMSEMYTNLRKDVETVAFRTQATFDRLARSDDRPADAPREN